MQNLNEEDIPNIEEAYDVYLKEEDEELLMKHF